MDGCACKTAFVWQMVAAAREIFVAYLYASSAGYLWNIVYTGIAIAKT